MYAQKSQNYTKQRENEQQQVTLWLHPGQPHDRRMQRRVQLLLCWSDSGSGGAGVATAGNEDNWFLIAHTRLPSVGFRS